MAAQLSAIRRILIDTTGETTVERIAAVMYPQMLLVDGQPQVDIDGQLHDLDG